MVLDRSSRTGLVCTPCESSGHSKLTKKLHYDVESELKNEPDQCSVWELMSLKPSQGEESRRRRPIATIHYDEAKAMLTKMIRHKTTRLLIITSKSSETLIGCKGIRIFANLG